MSDSVRPHRLQPTRFPHPWDSPGKNTGSGLPFPSPMHESEKWKLCPTLRDPMDCSLPGSSIHGIFQARVLEWVAIALSISYMERSLTLLGFPGGSDGNESACNAGEPGLIPELGRSPGEGNGYPLKYSCLENSMKRGVWWAKSMRSQRIGHNWVITTFTF